MKIRYLMMAATALAGVSLGLSGCNSAQSDWAKASSDNTIAAYQNFLAAHPKDPHASEAQTMILQFQDYNGWQEAQRAGTTLAYQTYLQQFPQGTHATAAKEAITTIERAADWKSARSAGTTAAIQSFLQKYPSGPESDEAKAKLRDLTAYRVHFANEATDAKAQRKLARLKTRLKDLAGALMVTPDSAGKSFSIDSEGMTEQEAGSACAAIKAHHEACQVVKQ